jgi:hypothetical protein
MNKDYKEKKIHPQISHCFHFLKPKNYGSSPNHSIEEFYSTLKLLLPRRKKAIVRGSKGEGKGSIWVVIRNINTKESAHGIKHPKSTLDRNQLLAAGKSHVLVV